MKLNVIGLTALLGLQLHCVNIYAQVHLALNDNVNTESETDPRSQLRNSLQKDLGINAQQAEEIINFQNEAPERIKHLRKEVGEKNFGGAWIEHDAQGKPYLAYNITSNPPIGTGFKGIVHKKASFTEKELDRAIEKLNNYSQSHAEQLKQAHIFRGE